MVWKMSKDNKTRHAILIREGTEHILDYLGTEHLQYITMAVSAFDDAFAQAATNAERKAAIRFKALAKQFIPRPERHR